MCRINGIKYFNQKKVDQTLLESMRDCLSYGGPDSANIYINEKKDLGLAHRRLAILDLSDDGIQPMRYKHWVIIFNGELYNFMDVRVELEALGTTFNTQTDTEVLLKAFERWGPDSINKFHGMFAFVIYDEQKDSLLFCRDRVGVKPLFLYRKDGTCLFASELKAFHPYPNFDKTINKDAVSLYLQQGYIHSPHCIFKNVRKLGAGTYLEIDKDGNEKETTYWKPGTHLHDGVVCRNKNEEELKEELEELLVESFNLRMVSDVPVGIFLSGGVDSSLVASMLQKRSNQQLKTFTIGFDDPSYNEAPFAKAIADHIGSDHHELTVTDTDFKKVVKDFVDIYDEPFGDSSGIPTFLLSQMTSQYVKVSLSADGGDEIFGGYTKYEMAKKIHGMPSFARKLLSLPLSLVSPEQLNKNRLLKGYTNVGIKVHKFKNAIQADGLVDLFNRSSVFLSEKDQLKIFSHYLNRWNGSLCQDDSRIIAQLGYIDIQTYLEGDIMTKVDRATMQHALEGREPLLDHKLIEFGLRLKDEWKIKNGKAKYLLRQVLYKYVPSELIDRPKQGFAIPLRSWLLNELLDDLKAMKEDQQFFNCFELNTSEICQQINDFISQKKYQNEYNIWFLFVLHKWYLKWMA